MLTISAVGEVGTLCDGYGLPRGPDAFMAWSPGDPRQEEEVRQEGSTELRGQARKLREALRTEPEPRAHS